MAPMNERLKTILSELRRYLSELYGETDTQAATIISHAEEFLALAEQMLAPQPPAKVLPET